MMIGTVIGRVVATQKVKSLVGYTLLRIKSEDGSVFVAADSLGAGIGATVIVTRGGAVQIALDRPAPIDAMVVGIVDQD